MESSKTLPTDMLFEILSRASFETVERSKVVSKELRQVINDPTFLPINSIRTDSLFGYYLQTWYWEGRADNIVLSLFVSVDVDASTVSEAGVNHHDDIPMEILASCDHGILCCMSHKNNRYYVCKPTTQQWQVLPHLDHIHYQTVAVAIVIVKSQPLHYMIVRLARPDESYICEIFDSKTWKWEKTPDPILYQDYITSYNNSAVTLGESVYWLTVNDNVLALDLNDERNFRCFSLPAEVVSSDFKHNWKQLMKYDGRLGFAYLTTDRKSMEVWVAEGQRWTRKMVVDMKFLEEGLTYPKVVDFFSTDAAFMKIGEDEGMFCNFRDDIFTRIEGTDKMCRFRRPQKMFRLRSDFETVDLKPPEINGRAAEDKREIGDVGPSWSYLQEVCAVLRRISKARLVSFYFPVPLGILTFIY